MLNVSPKSTEMSERTDTNPNPDIYACINQNEIFVAKSVNYLGWSRGATSYCPYIKCFFYIFLQASCGHPNCVKSNEWRIERGEEDTF